MRSVFFFLAILMSLASGPCQAAENEVKDGYTARQRFFIQYTKIWAQLITPEAEKQYANSDPHPPAFYRANETLKHFTPFYQNFNIKPGDQMYLAPGKRIKIW